MKEKRGLFNGIKETIKSAVSAVCGFFKNIFKSNKKKDLRSNFLAK